MSNHLVMFGSYLKTGLRALLRQKVHLALNLIGLSVGLAAAVLILLYVQFESGYDQMHPKAEKTYRVEQYFLPLEQRFPISSPAILAEFQTFDSRIQGTRMIEDSMKVRPQGAELPLNLDFLAIEPNFTDFFSPEVVSGDLTKTLSNPGNLALSIKQSMRLFGHTDSVGATLTSNKQTYTVTAVFKLPEQSHLEADALRLASDTILNQSLGINSAYTYVRLPENVDRSSLLKGVLEALSNKAYDGKATSEILFRALTDIHLHSQLSYELKTNGSWATLMTASVLALLLIIIAGINFINMSIARSSARAKEVGVRKTLGASRWQLFIQFMLESLMVAFIAGFIAAVLVEFGISAFNGLVNRPITLEYAGSFGFLLLLCSTAIGVLAGIYPALFISSFSARRVLSGDLQRGNTAVWIRKGLLVAQGAITVALLVGSVILHQQLNTLLNQDVGYKTDARLMVHNIKNEHLFWSENSSLINELRAIPGVRAASILDIDLTKTFSQVAQLRIPGQTQSDSLPPVANLGAGFDFAKATGINLLVGRDFEPSRQADWFSTGETQGKAAAIVTESLARRAGYSNLNDVIGESWLIDDTMPTELNIVGVVSDFQVGAALGKTEPAIIVAGRSPMPYANIILHLDPMRASVTRDEIERMLKQRLDRMDIRMSWLSANFATMYDNQQRQRTIITLFAGLAILLTCVGLFGLAAFSAEQRAREVAMRKVLGATRLQIVNTLASEYMILMAISVFIAVPTTYFLVERWLAEFTVRTQQSAFVYLAASILTFGICWLTVAGISLRVANKKPGAVLRQF